jgi:serine protease DegS
VDRLNRLFQFAGWPVVCGLLLALVYVQYQQLQRISDQLSTVPQAVSEPRQEPVSYAQAIGRAAPSVVSINATSVNVESVERASEDQLNLYLEESNSLGSGVVIDARGFILTNLHVVDTLFDAFDTQVTLSDGRRKPATVVAWDKTNDLAVLHINIDNLTPIEIGDDSNIQIGDVVFAIGYPHNIGQAVSQGIVSALSSIAGDSVRMIQTDAAINPGNSGGALIDLEGRLIGINTSIVSRSGNFEGIGFATPASIAVQAGRELISEAIAANSGYLGVLTGEALNEQSSQLFFGVDHIRGILVESVDEGGAAERAGIQPGDVITGVEDTPVTDAENIMMEIRNKKPGDTIAVRVYRNGRTYNLPTTLGFGQAIIIEP